MTSSMNWFDEISPLLNMALSLSLLLSCIVIWSTNAFPLESSHVRPLLLPLRDKTIFLPNYMFPIAFPACNLFLRTMPIWILVCCLLPSLYTHSYSTISHRSGPVTYQQFGWSLWHLSLLGLRLGYIHHRLCCRSVGSPSNSKPSQILSASRFRLTSLSRLWPITKT